MGFKTTVKTILKKVFGIGPEDISDYRKRGVVIGNNANLFSCELDYGHGYLISIGDNCTIVHSTILTHDASTKMFLGYTKIGRVSIGNNVFIGHGCVILPGVTIGDNVIIGAGSIVRKDIPSGSVVMGNPASIVCSLEEYIEKNKEKMKTAPVYDKYWEDKTKEDIQRIIDDLKGGTIGFDL